MELEFSPKEIAFRDEVRRFVAENLPDDLKEKAKLGRVELDRQDVARWHKILHAKGWAAPAWPVEHGGTDWTAMQRFIFEEEMTAAGAPPLAPFGIQMVGPVLIAFGNEEQKKRYLPKILSGEEFWCQGYSEPGSGSDLASLKTRAEDKGDHYLVNGQKIWTSQAHEADMIFCLTRTRTDGKPQEGITFLLIDMTSPGISARPIISIAGSHTLNEVFFEDVTVPKENRIGEENKGWTYAKFLLGNERTGIAGVGGSKAALARLKSISKAEMWGDGTSLYEQPEFRHRMANIEVTLMSLEYTNLRTLARIVAGEPVGAEASLLKIIGTEVQQSLQEMTVEALGYYAAPYGEGGHIGDNVGSVGPAYREGRMHEMLFGRAASIYGGSNEIQRNIIAKAVLGL